MKDYLVRKLGDAGQKCWPAIAAEISSELPVDTSASAALLRKIAYGDRDTLGLMTTRPIHDDFKRVEIGARKLPELADKADKAEA